MDERTGPTALVTGGGGGLGTATARRLVAAGAHVALVGRTPAALEAAAARIGPPAFPFPADVTDRSSVEHAVQEIARRLGTPTWVVNAAGVARSSPLLPPDDTLWQDTLAVNVTGAWHVITASVPGMLDAKGGAIVNVASTAAVRGYRYTAAYVASKHALLGLTRAIAEDLAGRRIRVNAVCPGFLDTPMTTETIDRIVATTGRSSDEVRRAIGAMNARGSLVPPEEVAEAIHGLLADETRTGDHVVIE